MRFNDYKLVLGLCASLKEALGYIINSGETSLIGDCIGAVNVISSFICGNENSVFDKEIPSLTEKIKDAVSSENISAEILKEAYNDTERLESLCMNGIKYRFRVLFVAELGSKWDSMESVYNEFIKREDCDVEVVIEPIFRAVRLPDGSIRSDSVYEDFLTPMGIENIPYEKYDISVAKPDITFVSQPYDGVTTSQFSIAYMSEHTKLIYLPYFTCQTIKNISGAFESFFKLDIEKYAYKIVCQSETMRQLYKDFGSSGGKNVITCGLPKWDYVYDKNKDNVPIPMGWEEKLNGRTVFLWNTHYTNDIDKMFDEWMKLIDFFLKNKDYALIWRPHPMAECVIKVYSPSAYPKFIELVKIIKNSENIIFDNNSSYLPSFVYSDALISSQSSIVTQYLLTEKPIIITRYYLNSENKEKYTTTIDGLFDYTKIQSSLSFSDTVDFIKKVHNKKDENIEERKWIIRNCFTLHDGKCGERVAETIMNSLYDEIDEKSATEINRVLVIGNENDSRLSVKKLEKLGIPYSLCKEFSDTAGAVSLSDISKDDFDLYIITEKNSHTLTEFLYIQKEIPMDIIIDFHKLYNAFIPDMLCDRVFMNPESENAEGIILGTSFAKHGIIPENLGKNFVDISIDFQDMHSQYKTLLYCMKNYPEKLKNIRYAVIDLYDYNYFNINTSLSKNAVEYIKLGGYSLEPHSFNKNKNFNMNFEQLKESTGAEKFSGLTNEQINIWSALFGDVYAENDYEGFVQKRERLYETITEEESNSHNGKIYNPDEISIIEKDNISENKKAFENLLKLLYEINPDIKIFTILIPKYIKPLNDEIGIMYPHKKQMNKIVSSLNEKYSFTHLDFYEISDIHFIRNYHYNDMYLNFLGASRFTEELKKLIFDS